MLAAPTDALACHPGIGDRVWLDSNGNGIQDPGEAGINGVRVTISPGYLSDPGDPGSPVITSRITGTGPGTFGDGYYLFMGVDCLRDYTIAVDPTTLPAGYVATSIRVGSNRATDSDDPIGTIVNVPASVDDLTIDFGFLTPTSQSGTGTPGYWKTHPEAWPVGSVVIGNVIYTKAQALVLLGMSVDLDKKLTMFMHLVSTKLNLLNGTNGSCITEDVAAADQWFITYGAVLNPAIKANSGAWRAGSATAKRLDDYNNGLLCAPHRD
jgi:hypothetical protein